MISDKIIKKEFVRQILERDDKFIRKEQAEVIDNYLTPRSGNLSADIRDLSMSKLVAAPGAWMLSVSFLKYLRFLDIRSNRPVSNSREGKAYITISSRYELQHKEMKLRRNLALYNRVVFGRIYNETQRDIKYGYTEAIKEEITKQLESAGYERTQK